MHLKLVSLLSSLVLASTLTACSNNTDSTAAPDSQPSSNSTTVTSIPQRLEDALRDQLERARASHR